MKSLFGPKTCKYNIDSMDDVFSALNHVCDKEKSLTDQELSDELKDIYNFCAGGKDGKNFYFITHTRSSKLVEVRAKKYCKQNKIKLKDYKGALPYRKHFIDSFEPDLKRKEKLNKIVDNINGEDHKHIESEDEKYLEYFERRFKENTLIPTKRK